MTTQEASEIVKKYNEWKRAGKRGAVNEQLLGEALDILLAYYEGTQQKTSPQDIPAIEEKIKAIDREIKEREQAIANAILRHKVWTRQIG